MTSPSSRIRLVLPQKVMDDLAECAYRSGNDIHREAALLLRWGIWAAKERWAVIDGAGREAGAHPPTGPMFPECAALPVVPRQEPTPDQGQRELLLAALRKMPPEFVDMLITRALREAKHQ